MRNRWAYVGLALCALAVGGATLYLALPRRQGAPKYAVSGRVTVNGRPGALMVVRFISANEKLAGQDRQPVATADMDGRFQLSSFGGNDGAAEGDYAVVFYWPDDLLAPKKDRLQGRFGSPDKSPFRATIPPKATELPPFELQLPPKDVLPAGYNEEELRKKLQPAPQP